MELSAETGLEPRVHLSRLELQPEGCLSIPKGMLIPGEEGRSADVLVPVLLLAAHPCLLARGRNRS